MCATPYGSRYLPIMDAQSHVVALQQAVALPEEGYLDCKLRRNIMNKLHSIAVTIAGADTTKTV